MILATETTDFSDADQILTHKRIFLTGASLNELLYVLVEIPVLFQFFVNFLTRDKFCAKFPIVYPILPEKRIKSFQFTASGMGFEKTTGFGYGQEKNLAGIGLTGV